MIKDYRNILVPFNFTETSINAANYAAQFANEISGEVVLLNVFETPGMLFDFFSSGDELIKIINLIHTKLNEFVGPLQAKWPAVKFSIRIERGKSYEKILEVAEAEPLRLIVLGENIETDEKKAKLGSTVYNVTLKSLVPVLTVKGSPSKLKNKILLPLDLTRDIEKQLNAAILYAKNYNAEIYLVSALIGGIEVKESRIYKKLKDAEKALKANQIKTNIKLFEVSNVPPFMRVLQYSEEIGAGMIIILTHQEGYTYDNYIGAFAHHIISMSKIPVLSLTASAVNFYFDHYLKNVVDPIGFLRK